MVQETIRLLHWIILTCPYKKGEFVAIVGASGSGKSTLLHILGSVDKPTEGKVLIEGTELSAMNRTQAAIFRRRKVGVGLSVFITLSPTLTVRKNNSHAAPVRQAQTKIRNTLSRLYIPWELKINWNHCPVSFPVDNSSELLSLVL